MRNKVQLLTLNGKVNDAIKYGNEALLPFIEHTMVVSRRDGTAGEDLLAWFFNYTESCIIMLANYRQASDIDAGLKLVQQVQARLAVGQKAGEVPKDIPPVMKAMLDNLKHAETYFKTESAKRRKAAMKSTARKVAVGLLVVSAIAAVTYGVMSTRNRFRN